MGIMVYSLLWVMQDLTINSIPEPYCNFYAPTLGPSHDPIHRSCQLRRCRGSLPPVPWNGSG